MGRKGSRAFWSYKPTSGFVAGRGRKQRQRGKVECFLSWPRPRPGSSPLRPPPAADGGTGIIGEGIFWLKAVITPFWRGGPGSPGGCPGLCRAVQNGSTLPFWTLRQTSEKEKVFLHWTKLGTGGREVGIGSRESFPEPGGWVEPPLKPARGLLSGYSTRSLRKGWIVGSDGCSRRRPRTQATFRNVLHC
jgi:hypothetical protein